MTLVGQLLKMHHSVVQHYLLITFPQIMIFEIMNSLCNTQKFVPVNYIYKLLIISLSMQPEVVEKLEGVREGTPRKDAKEVCIYTIFLVTRPLLVFNSSHRLDEGFGFISEVLLHSLRLQSNITNLILICSCFASINLT